MAIAVQPDDPRDRFERRLTLLVGIVVGVVLTLFVFAMLDAYVF